MRAAALGLGLAAALGLASCSAPPDTADTIGPATTLPPQASIALRPVVRQALPCDELPSEVDPSSVLPNEDPELACAEVGAAEGIDLARAEVIEGGAMGAEWVIEVEVADDDRVAANEQFNACADLEESCATGLLAIVVDDTIISAPQVDGRDLADESFVINGGGTDGFSRSEAEDLVDRISR